MSLTYNKNEKQDAQGSKKKDPDALMQKLNAAISSHFPGGSSKELGLNGEHDTESLLDIVKDVLDEGSNSAIKEEVTGEGNEFDIGDPVNDEGQGESEVPHNPGLDKDVSFDSKLFSGAFDEIEYQSVEIKVTEETPSVIPEEDSSRYAQIVKDALKSSPKQIVPTVLESEPAVQKAVLPMTGQESGLEKDEGHFSKKQAPTDVHPAKKGSLSNSSQMEDMAIPPKGAVSQRTEPFKDQTLKKIVSKPKKTLSSRVFSNKEPVPCCDIKKKDTIKDVLVQKTAGDVPVPEVVLLYNEKHVEHDPSFLSLKAHENPSRLIKAMWYLEKSGIFRNGQCTLMGDFDMASEEDLLRVHDESYIEFVRSYSSAGGGFLGDSTYMTSRSYEIAKQAAGAAMKAGSLVADGKYPYAFVMTRPPGHHASGNKYGGFCLFNNVAILARYLQKKKHVGKIMIIDWDAHAGDGTMDIFYNDPTVLFVSLHRDPHGFYPRKGFSKETGDGSGKGYTVNVEMPVGAGDDEYSLAFEDVVIPLVRSFSPEFIICSCGFDAYYKEKNIGLNLTSDGFHRMTSIIRSLCPKNFILLMEGGYHDFNGQLCHSVISALLDVPNPVDDKPEISSFKKSKQQQVFMEAQAKIAEVKKLVPLLI
ncbi:MAG: histone deacetylase [Methanolobus sp.]|nr:histone deacetylase [Methanolobus sp.]